MGKLKNRIPILLIEKERRDERRYSQRDMAVGTGLTDTAISRFMRHETLDNVSFASMVKIAEWLEVSPLDLFEKADED